MKQNQWGRQNLEKVLFEMGVKFPKDAPVKVLWRLYFQNQGKFKKSSNDIFDRGRRGSGHFNG